MNATKQLKAAGPVVERVLHDRRVQDQLLDAGDHLRKGVVALRKAGEAATESRRPPVGKVLVLGLVGAAVTAALVNKGIRNKPVSDGASASQA